MCKTGPLFFDYVPEFEARGEIMLVHWNGLDIALPIGICANACLLCEEELAKWRLARMESARVIQFPAHGI